MVVDKNEGSLERYKNIIVTPYEKVERFPDERLNTFNGMDKYKEVRDLAKKIFGNSKFFEVAPYFFEVYGEKEDSGILVDVKNLQITISNSEKYEFVGELEKLIREKLGIGYTVTVE